ALLEGMACARAIVASDIGGIPDALHHGENGLLVPPDNAEALAAAIRRLLLEPDYCAALGRAARQTVLQKFTPERELAENLAVYRRFYPKPAELSGASSTAETASVISGAAPSALLKSMVIGSSPSPGSMTTSREMERRSAMGPSISTRPRM
ncbi:MAG TPA: glycosyltransferase, partial [Anaerolineae bacterium]|nr:glycosyltransferase [Anaerolineae bacterium]